MGKKSKRLTDIEKKLDFSKHYNLDEGLGVLKTSACVKYDESVDVAIRLGVDPRHADQMVRGSAVLPHGLGKSVRVLAFAKGEKVKEAEDAGADYVGGEDMVKKVSEGWLDFDKAVATPDMMALVGKVGRVLGPRGLMPNPKSGTVTFDLARAIKEIKAGKVDFRVEKAGIIHAAIGKASFAKTALYENVVLLLETIAKLKPSSSKGQYIQKVTLSTTMGPSVILDVQGIRKMFNV